MRIDGTYSASSAYGFQFEGWFDPNFIIAFGRVGYQPSTISSFRGRYKAIS